MSHKNLGHINYFWLTRNTNQKIHHFPKIRLSEEQGKGKRNCCISFTTTYHETEGRKKKRYKRDSYFSTQRFFIPSEKVKNIQEKTLPSSHKLLIEEFKISCIDKEKYISYHWGSSCFSISNFSKEESPSLSPTSPKSLVFHESGSLLQKLCCLPKEWPSHGPWREALLPVPHLIPSQQTTANNQEAQCQPNHPTQDHHPCTQAGVPQPTSESWKWDGCAPAPPALKPASLYIGPRAPHKR